MHDITKSVFNMMLATIAVIGLLIVVGVSYTVRRYDAVVFFGLLLGVNVYSLVSSMRQLDRSLTKR